MGEKWKMKENWKKEEKWKMKENWKIDEKQEMEEKWNLSRLFEFLRLQIVSL